MASAAVEELVKSVNPKSLDYEEITGLREKAFKTPKSFQEAYAQAANWKGTRETQGMYLFFVGEYQRAFQILEKEAASEGSKLLFALAAVELNQPDKALKALEGMKGILPEKTRARAFILLHEEEKAEKILKTLESTQSGDPDVRLLQIELLFRSGKRQEAFEAANDLLKQYPDHEGALFTGGLIASQCDENRLAIERYESLAQFRPVNAPALINLGILYEDAGDYTHAIRCYEAILKHFPNHERAKLYLKDAQASVTMYYDEDRERKEDKRLQVLRTPVSDFELSVRSRNCLTKMDIESLGDLIQKTESELLTYKNFGETSLLEIKAILSAKGLRLGMGKEEALRATSIDDALEMGSSKHKGVLGESIDTLELSVRARKCMERLNATTIGDLVANTEQQLLSTPNFGATSLIEVKRKLAELGLSLET